MRGRGRKGSFLDTLSQLWILEVLALMVGFGIGYSEWAVGSAFALLGHGV